MAVTFESYERRIDQIKPVISNKTSNGKIRNKRF